MAEEAVDKSNEIFDYESSKPYIKAWADGFSETTDGKSFGNVRAMHSTIAAGKLIGIAFDDKTKKIPVVAKIIDDNEWKKVAEGVYTGFSIGGKYVKKWTDGTVTRYTANPSEVSIVDNPCMYGAQFAMVKENGATELRKFAPASEQRPAPSRFQPLRTGEQVQFVENGLPVRKLLGDNAARNPQLIRKFAGTSEILK
jgi:hypothetical protein